MLEKKNLSVVTIVGRIFCIGWKIKVGIIYQRKLGPQWDGKEILASSIRNASQYLSSFHQYLSSFCIFCSEKKPDDQKHTLECKGLIKHLKSEKVVQKKIEYSDIYKDTLKQKNVTALFSELLKVKNELMESYNPSTSSHEVLKISYNVQP